MSKPEVLEKSPMNLAEVKAALEGVRKADPDTELNFRAQKTEEYVQELAKLNAKKAKELFDALMKLEVPRIKEQHVHKLVDLLPATDRQVKLILSTYHLTVSAENVKKLTETVAGHIPKK